MRKAAHYAFRRPDGSFGVCYWHSDSNVLTQTYDGTVSVRLHKRYGSDVRLIDLLSGDIYHLPPSMICEDGSNYVTLSHLPIKDYPLLLTFGDFYTE